MKKFALSTLVCAALAAGAFSAHASGLGDALRGQLGGATEGSSSSSSGLGSNPADDQSASRQLRGRSLIAHHPADASAGSR